MSDQIQLTNRKDGGYDVSTFLSRQYSKEESRGTRYVLVNPSVLLSLFTSGISTNLPKDVQIISWTEESYLMRVLVSSTEWDIQAPTPEFELVIVRNRCACDDCKCGVPGIAA